MARRLLAILICLLAPSLAFAQANGKLQIHYMDVGQGDGAVLISPQGEVVLFDGGVLNQCGKPIGYLQWLGITSIDYHIASHYHSDHIGCTPSVLGAFPLQKGAYDRGGTYTTGAFTSYVNAVNPKRLTATLGGTITLDAGSANPVIITFKALNAAGISTNDENDKSLVALVKFGQFDAEFGGDLSGASSGVPDDDPGQPQNPAPAPNPTPTPAPTPGPNTCAKPAAAPATTTAVCNNGQFSASQNRSGTCSSNGGVRCWVCPGKLCSGLVVTPAISLNPGIAASYADIETAVANAVGQIEVYKVHHHGSRFSSNASWLATTTPKVGIISVGAGNTYGHPTAEALARLHAVGAKTYWTSAGNGAPAAAGQDVIAGNVIVEVIPNASTFTVRYGSSTDSFPMWGSGATPGVPGRAPVGSVDTPTNNAIVAGEVPFTGWAVDDSGITAVEVYRARVGAEPVQANGLVFVGTATFVPGARPDIVAAYPSYPGVAQAGWGLMVLSNMLPNQGSGTFTLSAFAKSGSGETQLLGSKSFVGANASSTKPFGTIDTPAQGATVSGVMTNFGWVLTPQPKTVPVDGSTITVYIDDVAVGHPVYNNFRSDIATSFPGFRNSNGAVGFLEYDTRVLANGLHTISWVATDNQGQTQGMGSRFFTVANP